MTSHDLNLRNDSEIEAHYQDQWENFGGRGGISEIEEVVLSEEFKDNRYDNNNNSISKKLPLHLHSIKEETSSVYSFGDENSVYVAIGKEENISMDALNWVIDNVVIRDSSVLFLIHVFPETKYIPTPLGKLPISQVNPEQKENHLAKERGKRTEYLQKFLNVCSASQVKVDTILIESDMEAKAILDLIPILNIKKLVLGATKSNVRKLRYKRGNGVVDQIVQNAPEICEVKIVCEGKEMSEMMNVDSPTPYVSSPLHSNHRSPPKSAQEKETEKENENDEVPPACGCFKL